MTRAKERLKYYIGGIVMLAALIGLDQYTKELAIVRLKGQEPFQIIKGVFCLQYLENRGAAFGLLQNQFILFIISFILITAIISYFYHVLPFTKRVLPLRICGLLVIAGGAGNMIDRIFRGYVVDFFYFELIDFPIFNVADIYVTAAVLLLAVLILFVYNEEETERLFTIKRRKE